NERIAGENRRVNSVVASTGEEMFDAQRDLSHNELHNARTTLSSLRSRIESEKDPTLRKVFDRAGLLLSETERRIAEQKAMDRDRTRYQEFVRLWDETSLHEARFEGLDLPASREATERSARAALAVFGAAGPNEAWALQPLPARLASKQQVEVREGCYEL